MSRALKLSPSSTRRASRMGVGSEQVPVGLKKHNILWLGLDLAINKVY